MIRTVATGLVTAVALAAGSQAWAQSRPTLQGLQDQLANTYTRAQVNSLLRPADPACFDNTNRYVDCNNGTVTDTVTGLIWLKQADCMGALDYAAATASAARLQAGACGLTDGSRPGDWRLPTEQEWQSTLFPGPDCVHPSLTNTAGTGCFGDGPRPFSGVEVGVYWSATANLDRPAAAWTNDLHYSEQTALAVTGQSSIIARDKSEPHRVWPVRGAASTQPVYEANLIRSQIAEGLALASPVRAMVAEYYFQSGMAPLDNAALDLPAATGTYVSGVTVVNGRVDITYRDSAHNAIAGKVLSSTPYLTSEISVVWRCGNRADPGGVLLGTGTSGPIAIYQPTLIADAYMPIDCHP